MAILFRFFESAPAAVRFGTFSTRFGWVIVGETDAGVCAVALAGRKQDAQHTLADIYPETLPVRQDETPAARQVAAYLAGERRSFDLAVDMAATPFQQMVWQELCKIPFGETTTYSALAQRLGKPRAVRAVARACATNPIALIVPCHRVVRADGNLAGYRWDVSRKAQLLNLERGD